MIPLVIVKCFFFPKRKFAVLMRQNDVSATIRFDTFSLLSHAKFQTNGATIRVTFVQAAEMMTRGDYCPLVSTKGVC